jgi:hypothetical protein
LSLLFHYYNSKTVFSKRRCPTMMPGPFQPL